MTSRPFLESIDTDHKGIICTGARCQYTVLTADGMTQPARRKFISHLGDTDLALVQFESKKLYRVAALGDSNALPTGERVYASGFPNYKYLNKINYTNK